MNWIKENRMPAIIIGNTILAILEIYAVGWSLITNGLGTLQYYTELSNLFSGIVSIYVVYQIHQHGDMSLLAKVLRYMAVCLTTITFLVVITVLGPIYGYVWILFSGTMIWTHTLCPLLSSFLFLFVERQPQLEKRHILLSLWPTFGYGIVAIILNICHLIVGPYPFLMVLEQSILTSILWALALLAGAYIISLAYYYWDIKHQDI